MLIFTSQGEFRGDMKLHDLAMRMGTLGLDRDWTLRAIGPEPQTVIFEGVYCGHISVLEPLIRNIHMFVGTSRIEYRVPQLE